MKPSMTNAVLIDTWGWLTLNDAGERRHQEVADLYRILIAQNTFTGVGRWGNSKGDDLPGFL